MNEQQRATRQLRSELELRSVQRHADAIAETARRQPLDYEAWRLIELHARDIQWAAQRAQQEGDGK